jgi:hypothetical protein
MGRVPADWNGGLELLRKAFERVARARFFVGDGHRCESFLSGEGTRVRYLDPSFDVALWQRRNLVWTGLLPARDPLSFQGSKKKYD